jgi:deoxyribose-phosphate aldolase
MTRNEIAKYIDHTNLKPDATTLEINKLCEEAIKYGFFSVCVNPYRVKMAYNILKDTSTQIVSVIGFPLGATTSKIKSSEAKIAIENGATELDMVINIGALKDRSYDIVKKDIMSVVKIAAGLIVKVIIECCYLSDEEKIKACKIISQTEANYIKTSTGFGPSGASINDITLISNNIPKNIKIKAAGGIRDFSTACSFINHGASRIGTSHGVNIVCGE